MSELIQCEFCEVYIEFDEYLNHIKECEDRPSMTPISDGTYSNFTYSISDISNMGEDENELEDIDEEMDYSINSNNLNNQLNYIINTLNNLESLDISEENRNIFERYSNLEDVKNPVKNIDLVAPIIEFDTLQNTEMEDDLICAICQETLTVPVRKTICNHYFCSKCIEPWLKELNKKCPNCLRDLDELLKQ
jgi:hypothetical protein